MRILFVANLYPPLWDGGAERATRRQVDQLNKAGHDVTVLTTDGKTSLRPDVRPRLGSSGVFEFSSPNVYHTLARPGHRWTRPVWAALDLINPIGARVVSQVAKRVRPDLIVTANLWNISTSVWRPLAAHAPLVHILHDGATLCQSGFLDHEGRDCFGTLQPCRTFLQVRRGQSSAVNTVIAPSNFLLDKTVSAGLFRNARREYVPNPPPALPPRVDRTRGRGPLHVAFVGNVERYKGFDVLAEACRSPYVASLHVLGDGNQDLVHHARGYLGRKLVLHGRVGSDRVAEVLASCDALVMPSTCQENVPTVLLEGQASGLAVVSSRSGGAPEIIRDGFDGLIVDRRSSVQIRAALELLAREPDLRFRMGLAARATAEGRIRLQDRFVATVESVT